MNGASWRRVLIGGGGSMLLLAGCQLPAGAPEAPSAPGQATKVISARDIGPKATLLPKATPRPENEAPAEENRREEQTASDAEASDETAVSESPDSDSTAPGTPTVTFVAGSGEAGHADGAGAAAAFYTVAAIAVGPAGDVYVLDEKWNNSYAFVRHVSPAGLVTTIAGKNGSALARVDGVGDEAEFLTPVSLALGSDGMLVVNELPKGPALNRPEDGSIRDVDPATGKVTSRFLVDEEGYVVAPGLGLAIDADNHVLITPTDSNAKAAGRTVRRIDPEGVTTIIAGSEAESAAHVDGPIDQARFADPGYLAVAKDGRIFVTDRHRVRVITPGEKVSTLAGSERGFKDGRGSEAAFTFLRDITVDEAGNAYVIDQVDGAQILRMITPEGQVRTLKFESPLLQNITEAEASTKGVLHVFADGKLLKVELAL